MVLATWVSLIKGGGWRDCLSHLSSLSPSRTLMPASRERCRTDTLRVSSQGGSRDTEPAGCQEKLYFLEKKDIPNEVAIFHGLSFQTSIDLMHMK